jgi:adenylosuccinate synthase
VRPVYETVPGWGAEIDGAARIEDLPDAARDYIRFVEELAGVRVSFVSVGPGREQTVVLPRAA